MKKNIIKATFLAAIAMVCGVSFLNTQKSETLSEVALANVEALADDEHQTICTGFYFVCASEFESFKEEKKKNCDVDEIEYEVLFGC